MRTLLCFLLLSNVYFLTSQTVFAKVIPLYVFSKEGNIYYEPNEGKTLKLTTKNIDENPILSPNRHFIAFIRRSNQIIPKGCGDFSDTGSKYGNEIWIYDFESKKERLLVANNFDCNTPEKLIVDPTDLQFSPDSKTLYFITSAWVTSGAVHAVNTDGTGQRYVIPANSLEVIPIGEYKGFLIVNQHRYFIGAGSYDWYWVFSPSGKEEGPLGPEVESDQKSFLQSE